MQETSAMVGGILAVVHPELYKIGRDAILALSKQPHPVSTAEHIEPVLKEWTSPFSAISVMANRACPFHRDVHGRNPWYDILLTVGEYENGRLDIPGIGIRLLYDSGTIVPIAGKVVRHGVPTCAGERLSIAYYMRDNVHERLGLPAGTWMNRRQYST